MSYWDFLGQLLEVLKKNPNFYIAQRNCRSIETLRREYTTLLKKGHAMNTIKSRFERFASFSFSSADSFDKGADLWDTISHYEFYLTEKGDPNDTFLARLEELGCSRRWLLYASGEMFAENERGKLLRYKFMQGIGLSNKTVSLTAKAKANIPDRAEAKPAETVEEEAPNRVVKETVKEKAPNRVVKRKNGKAQRKAKKQEGDL